MDMSGQRKIFATVPPEKCARYLLGRRQGGEEKIALPCLVSNPDLAIDCSV